MKISLIIVYFGKWPVWFPAFLQSCKYNPEIDWLVFTDCETPECQPGNVKFIPCSMSEFNRLASKRLGFPVVHDSPYKLCDYKPAYGLVFQDYLKGYDFWGHCDIDLVWGDIRYFITDSILEQHDVISSRKNLMSGHFSLYRNNEPTSKLFTLHRQYRDALSHVETVSFDEVYMTLVVTDVVRQGHIKAYWPRFVLDDEFSTVLQQQKSGWLWEKGKFYNENNDREEIMYLHFSEWKDTLVSIGFGYQDDPDAFYITPEGICLPG